MFDEATALNAAFDATGVKFHDRAAALAAFKENHHIEYNEVGTPMTFFDGEHIELRDALTRYGYDSPDGVCDRRTLPREGSGGGRRGTLSRADFTTSAEKSKFIAEHGITAWEKLPSKNTDGQEVVTKQDWYRLSRAEKVRRTEADPNAFAKLPNGTPSIVGSRANGVFINRSAIDKHLAARPQRTRR